MKINCKCCFISSVLNSCLSDTERIAYFQIEDSDSVSILQTIQYMQYIQYRPIEISFNMLISEKYSQKAYHLNQTNNFQLKLFSEKP
jgi:hypothetical protein